MKRLLLMLGWLTAQSYSWTNRVVDLSHWNTADLRQAQNDGILGVIHKATQGQSYIDSTYLARRAEAAELGLLWGAYHFGSKGSGRAQADHFLATVGNSSQVLLALDLEPNGANTMDLNEAEEFVMRVVEVEGRYPLLYGSSWFLSTYLGSDVLGHCGLWVAHYTANDSPRLPKGVDSWLFWQYTDGVRGGSPRHVVGIGPCDRDRFNGTETDLANWPYFAV